MLITNYQEKVGDNKQWKLFIKKNVHCWNLLFKIILRIVPFSWKKVFFEMPEYWAKWYDEEAVCVCVLLRRAAFYPNTVIL
jgi:hypothetical protein